MLLTRRLRNTGSEGKSPEDVKIDFLQFVKSIKQKIYYDIHRACKRDGLMFSACTRVSGDSERFVKKGNHDNIICLPSNFFSTVFISAEYGLCRACLLGRALAVFLRKFEIRNY